MIKLIRIQQILHAALLCAGQPLTLDKMLALFDPEEKVEKQVLLQALSIIEQECLALPYSLKEVASGYRFQVKSEFSPWIVKLWEEKPPRYSKATLETLALIAYRQPITRAEIEDIRGVSAAAPIVKALLEREWVKVVGHRDVPGKPSLYATTKQFLDYFNLKSLEELPTLAELMDFDNASLQLGEQFQLIIDQPSGEAPFGSAEPAQESQEAMDGVEVSKATDESIDEGTEESEAFEFVNEETDTELEFVSQENDGSTELERENEREEASHLTEENQAILEDCLTEELETNEEELVS